MKKFQMASGLMAALALVMVLAMATPAKAQDEMRKDDWQEAMKTATAERSDLQNQITTLDKEINDLKGQITQKDGDVKACEDALFALLGVTRDQWEAYQRDLAAMEKRVAELQGMSDDQLGQFKDELLQMQDKLDEMSKSNISKLSRFGNRVKALQDKVAALLQSAGGKAKTYTVGTWARNHDCLWNIAKKPSIYGNAWMWPKIWQGNRDKIKDPDRIKPKWVLKIPEGTELSKAEKSAARRYYGRKGK
jgi:flagellar biosynthesis chaperone FliJ